MQAIADALQVYAGLAVDLAVPLVGLAVLLILQHGPRQGTAGPLLVLLVSAAALSMYSLVLVEPRYVAPFLVLLVLGLLTLIRPTTPRVAALETPIGLMLVALMVLQIAIAMSEPAGAVLSEAVSGQLRAPDEHARVAVALRSAGVLPGDRIASGNRGFNAYWARLARVSIVAEVSGYDGTAILEAETDTRAAAQRLLLAQDIRALVARGWPALTSDPGWHAVDGTDYFYYLKPSAG